MTPDTLVLLIGMVCGVGNNIPSGITVTGTVETYNKKVDCIEHFTNCMVKAEGKIDPKDFNNCKKAWKK